MENKAEPKVSVIIPTYNRPQLIARAVESVLEQTYKNLEVIVIDGDPTGATGKMLEPLVKKHPGIVVDFVFQQLPRTNTAQDMANIARNRNAGIRIATGKYIAPIDDDDCWPDKKKIEKQVAFFEAHPDCVLVSGNTLGVLKKLDGTEATETNCYPEEDREIRKMMLMPFGLMNSSVMYRKSDWEKVSGYDEIHPMGETADFHMKLGRIGKFHNIPDYFVRYTYGEHARDHIASYGRYLLRYGMRLAWVYRKDYPGFFKAYTTHLMYLVYSFVPSWMRAAFRPTAMKIQAVILRRFAGTDTEKEWVK
jgi:glycosyltransferase involved in cell wall biosynthesis